MSEFWVSRKKWTCKYCDITINDDVPSRQQHENGLRHKGNVERSLRQAYKKSERDRKVDRDAKREMDKIEKLAQQSYARDVASGSSVAGPSNLSQPASTQQTAATPNTSTSKSTVAAGAAAWKPTDRMQAYGSAIPFDMSGIPSAEEEQRALQDWQERQEARRREGVAGEWQTVTLPSTSTTQVDVKPSLNAGEDTPDDASTTRNLIREKQGRFRNHDDDEDGLDTSAPAIVVKKRIKINSEAERLREIEARKKEMLPDWTPVKLGESKIPKRAEIVRDYSVPKDQAAVVDEMTDKQGEEVPTQFAEEEVTTQLLPVEPALSPAPPPIETTTSSSSMFKKRKAGAGLGAKKVRAVI